MKLDQAIAEALRTFGTPTAVRYEPNAEDEGYTMRLWIYSAYIKTQPELKRSTYFRAFSPSVSFEKLEPAQAEAFADWMPVKISRERVKESA